MEARSQLRHRPTCCRDATFLLSPLGLDSSISSQIYQFSRLHRGRTLSRIPFPIRHSMAPFEAARLRPNQKNFRDWEHLQGGPVSKTIESVGQMVQQAIARFPRTP